MVRVSYLDGRWYAYEIDSVDEAADDIQELVSDDSPVLIANSVEEAEATLHQDVELVGDVG